MEQTPGKGQPYKINLERQNQCLSLTKQSVFRTCTTVVLKRAAISRKPPRTRARTHRPSFPLCVSFTRSHGKKEPKEEEGRTAGRWGPTRNQREEDAEDIRRDGTPRARIGIDRRPEFVLAWPPGRRATLVRDDRMHGQGSTVRSRGVELPVLRGGAPRPRCRWPLTQI